MASGIVCHINRLNTRPHRPPLQNFKKPLPTESRPHTAISDRIWVELRAAELEQGRHLGYADGSRGMALSRRTITDMWMAVLYTPGLVGWVEGFPAAASSRFCRVDRRRQRVSLVLRQRPGSR